KEHDRVEGRPMPVPTTRGSMKHFKILNTWLLIPAALVAALIAAKTLFASTDDGLKIPADFQHGYLANSMLVTKEPNKTGLITGVHLIYVNRVGFDRLKRGSTLYPDGTVFVDDVRNFSIDDDAYQQGDRKFLTVMVKDSKQYAS